ncbi:HAMP domain-containing sensor histidine kinase [Ruminococcus flavefaciens]|uniref:histidine kinase n=1 Tax=Ruminococcus flavefaciens TaxID=1265 RepID=A0A1M7GQ24_RUMFL|nr:HAMP domain-containing sensor histidine kinase [Ruminococcus flavefaciens]SHM17999.1 Signal transduction histidine kinase [Ruminococcus flavefaciens]
MKCKTNSFRKKLLSWFMFFTVVIFTVLWLLQTVFLQKFYNGMIIRNTIKVADKIASEGQNSDITSYIDDISRSNSILVFVTDTDGNIIYSSDEYKKGHRGRFRDERSDFKNEYHQYRELPENYSEFLSAVNASDSGEAELQNDDIYVYGRLIDYYGSDEKVVLYVGTTLNAVGSTARIIRIQLMWVTLLSIIIAFVLALFMSKSFSKPVSQLNEKAHKLGENDNDTEFGKGFCTELDELNKTLDTTSEKLKKNREFQNELLANVSHDLRTPLTMIKGYAEMIRDISREDEKQCAEDVAVIVEETDRLTALVNEILEYSELQMSDREAVMNDVDLSETVSSVADSFGKLYSKDGYDFERNIADSIHVKGNISRLQRAIYNLLDNAVRHAGEDKWVGISLRTDNGKAIIEISDHGSGIAPEELGHIWDRYYTKRQRSGKGVSGLGLAIVKQIVSQHNGVCKADSEVGAGSVFSIELDVE